MPTTITLHEKSVFECQNTLIFRRIHKMYKTVIEHDGLTDERL